MLPVITGEFGVVADPELHFTPSGMAIARIRLVADKQKKTDSGEWVDDKVLWIEGTAFKQMAENVAESVRKGDKVVVVGKIQTDQWEDKNSGEKRSKVSLTIDDIGVSMRFRQVLHSDGAGNKVTRSSEPDANDPWATPPPDEPPF